MKPSLKRRSLRAGAWAGGSNAASQVVRLVGNLVLARFLMPEAFGMVAVVSTLMMGLNLLSDIGTGTVVIQSQRGAERDFLDTAWTLQALRGFGLWFAGVGLSLGIGFGQARQWFTAGTAYSDSALPLLIGVATLGLAIQGLASINLKVAERALDLRMVSLIELGAQVLALAFMVVAAILTKSVWSLIFGGLVAASLKCAASHIALDGPRAAFRLEPSAAKELLGKGKWVLLSSLLGFLALSGDRLLLGGLIDSATLGLYSIALALASIGPAALSAILSKVVFPALSEVVRDRPAELGRTYRRFQQITDGCVGFLAGLLVICSNAIVALLYDSRYHGAGAIMAILAVGSIGMRAVVIEQIYLAVGQPSLLALAAVPRVATLMIGIPIGYSMGQLDGALAAIVLSQFAQWPLAFWFRRQHALNDIRNDLVLPAAIAAGWGTGWLGLKLLSLLGVVQP